MCLVHEIEVLILPGVCLASQRISSLLDKSSWMDTGTVFVSLIAFSGKGPCYIASTCMASLCFRARWQSTLFSLLAFRNLWKSL